MEKRANIVIYFSSSIEIDLKVKELFEKQSNLLIYSSLDKLTEAMQSYKETVVLLVVDLRGEPDFGKEKLASVSKTEELAELPLLTVCSHNDTRQFTEAVKYGAEIINLPVDEAAFIRRCNRACTSKY